jgi:NADH-quinone oxidoreductase subunit N
MAGAVVMTSYSNLSMLFIGIEILSISLYVLAASNKKDRRSNEAGFKYFLMGSFVSGFLLLGIALVYGATGTFNLLEMRAYIASGVALPGFFYVGVILILLAMLFKISAAPFHFWAPDVYEGAPTPITAFMSTIVKTAAFAAFYRLFSTSFVSLDYVWVNIVIVLAGLTLAVGNITAVFQTNVKRMLAYSSIAHAGYMLLALAALTSTSSGSILFYATAYSFASISAFVVLINVFKAKGSYDISAFNGLAKSNPLLAFTMTVSMLSLAGIPPFAGFFAKYFIFTTALNSDMLWIVLVAVLASLVGVYYYFKVIIAMYFGKADVVSSYNVSQLHKALLVICLLITLALGIFPGLLSNLL